MLLCSILLPAQRIVICAVIGGKNAVASRLSILAPKIQALPVAADADTRDLLRPNPRLLHHTADDRAVILPHLLHVPPIKPGRGFSAAVFYTTDRTFRSISVKQRRLCRSPAVVES